MTIFEFSSSLSGGQADKLFSRIYGNSEMELLRQRARFLDSAECFSRLFPERQQISVYSAPATMKIGGDFLETAISVGVSADIIAVTGFHNKGVIRIKSGKTPIIEMKTEELPTEKNDLISRLICGIAEDMGDFTGFDAYINSDIPNISSFSATEQTSDFDFSESGYSLCSVNICNELSCLAEIDKYNKCVAKVMGVDSLSVIDEDEFYEKIPKLREKCDHRAIMSAVYYYGETGRMAEELEMLSIGRLDEFFPVFSQSGDSVAGVYSMHDEENNFNIMLGISVARRFLNGSGAVGFSHGAILAFVPNYMVNGYTSELDRIFGYGSTSAMVIRNGSVSKIFS